MNTFEKDKTYITHTYNRYPVCFVKGEGSHLYDDKGKEYIDMGTGIGVSMKGSTLLLRTRDFDGKLTAGECLADLNGAYFGYAIAPSLLKKTLPNNTIPFKGASFTLSPDNGSFKMEMKVLTGSDKNSLATIISLLAAMQKENRL